MKKTGERYHRVVKASDPHAMSRHIWRLSTVIRKFGCVAAFRKHSTAILLAGSDKSDIEYAPINCTANYDAERLMAAYHLDDARDFNIISGLMVAEATRPMHEHFFLEEDFPVIAIRELSTFPTRVQRAN
jgi:hypothetical protein